jgi:hypothetical protein
MDAAAIHVMKAYPQVALAFGESDEFRYSISLLLFVQSNLRVNQFSSQKILRFV